MSNWRITEVVFKVQSMWFSGSNVLKENQIVVLKEEETNRSRREEGLARGELKKYIQTNKKQSKYKFLSLTQSSIWVKIIWIIAV